MRTKIYLVSIITLLLVLVYACSKDGNSPEMTNESTPKLSIRDAKVFFENTFSQFVSTKNLSRSEGTGEEQTPDLKGLTPLQFTPQWDKAVTSSNECTSCVNVPIVSLEKYYAQDKSSQKIITLAQKMIVLQDNGSEEKISLIVTLLPTDGGNSLRLIDDFIQYGENDGFTGIALYTLLDGALARVELYQQGEVLKSLFVHKEHFDSKDVNEIIGDFEFLKSNSISLYRSGEGGGSGGSGPYPFCTYCGKMLRYCDCTHHNNPTKNYWDCPICFPEQGTCSICYRSLAFCKCEQEVIEKYCQKCGGIRNVVNQKCSSCGSSL